MKWIVVLVVLIVGAVAYQEMSRGGGLSFGEPPMMVNTLPPTSPLYAQQQEFVDRFNADPELRERFADQLTSKGLYAEMRNALARGAKSLDEPSLIKATRAMAAVMPRLPEHSCAKMMRPRDDFDLALSADVNDALARLPAHHHRNLWDFYLRALKAEVDDAPIRPANAEHRQNALQQLGSIYINEEAMRLISVMQNPETSSDADACWAIKTLTHASTRLSPQGSYAMSRMLWAGEE